MSICGRPCELDEAIEFVKRNFKEEEEREANSLRVGDRQKRSRQTKLFVSLAEKRDALTAWPSRLFRARVGRRATSRRLVAEPLSKYEGATINGFRDAWPLRLRVFPPPPLKTQEYKFHARQFAKSGVAMRMLSAPILICSLASLWRIRPEKFKEYSNLGRRVHARTQTHVRACVSSSLLLPLARTFMHRDVRGMCVEQFTPTRSAAANSVYFHWLFLFRALLKTVERCLKIRRALYRLLLHTHTRAHVHPPSRVPSLGRILGRDFN